MNKAPTAVTRKRILSIAAAVTLIGFGSLIFRLFNLQIVNAEEYQAQAAKQQLKVTELSATRGTIYDANGNILAISSTAWTVCISPVDISNDTEKELIVGSLSEMLGVSEDYVRAKCERNTYYETIKKNIDRPLAEEVTQFAADNGITAIYLEEDNKRYYPYDNFASDLLGFTNSDNSGAYGIESYYDKVLSGTSGKVVSAKNAWGTEMPYDYEEMYASEDGNSLKLTIDEGIQHFVEKNLEIAVKEHSVQKRGTCIVMDANTGAILAMSTKGDFDPNNPLEISDEAQAEVDSQTTEEAKTEAKAEAQFTQWSNKAISEAYEPGSVFKIITLSAALDTNTTTVNDTFFCSGSIQVADRRISCWKTAGHGQQTLAEAVRNSCNPAFITIGLRLGVENFCKYFEAFGLTEETGIDLPGEGTGIFYDPDTMTEINLASCSFGQTFKVMPIQLITAVCAAVNGGYLYQPYVVSEVLSSDGTVISETEPTMVRQVISEGTSATVRELLAGVVEEGSGRSAKVPGYRIGGKTGTSEKLDQKAEDGVERYVSSFLAVAPIDDPQIVILMLLDEAQMENPYGSVVAAPVVGAMLADILPYMGIEPVYTDEELALMDGTVPYVEESIVHDAMNTLRQKGYSSSVVGEGTTVIKQVPEAGAKMDAGGTVYLYTEESVIPGQVEVPDVLGMSVTDVNNAIIGAGLKLKLTGVSETALNQIAYSQFPEAGTLVYPDSVVEVAFTVGTAGEENSEAD
ncbi:MAG TPA: penicillin-binding transpeptidase domain-containing protein [Oscillospiraceae bacterium]|nr:penicillin-binding transpeptidase domain-containing protein [Oscillospiraceae bacterium]